MIDHSSKEPRRIPRSYVEAVLEENLVGQLPAHMLYGEFGVIRTDSARWLAFDSTKYRCGGRCVCFCFVTGSPRSSAWASACVQEVRLAAMHSLRWQHQEMSISPRSTTMDRSSAHQGLRRTTGSCSTSRYHLLLKPTIGTTNPVEEHPLGAAYFLAMPTVRAPVVAEPVLQFREHRACTFNSASPKWRLSRIFVRSRRWIHALGSLDFRRRRHAFRCANKSSAKLRSNSFYIGGFDSRTVATLLPNGEEALGMSLDNDEPVATTDQDSSEYDGDDCSRPRQRQPRE